MGGRARQGEGSFSGRAGPGREKAVSVGGRARQGEGSFSGRAGQGREKEVSVGEQGQAGRRKFQWEAGPGREDEALKVGEISSHGLGVAHSCGFSFSLA